MKNFVKPCFEIVRFGNAVIATSNCGCWDGYYVEDDDCTGDGPPQCTCQVNYDPAVANCIPRP